MNVETANNIAAAMRLQVASAQLVSIVDGVKEPHGAWRSKWKCGQRLKDTPEWAEFYCAFKATDAKSSNSDYTT